MKTLKFLNLLDQNGQLSVTQVLLYVMTIKIVTIPTDWTAAVAFLFTLLNYAHKRSVTSKTKKVQDTDLSARVSLIEQTQDTVFKQSEETKRLLSQANLANAFQPTNKLRTTN